MGHRAWGMGHRAWGMGHGAWDIESENLGVLFRHFCVAGRPNAYYPRQV
ncbi:hypothetical protein [Microcoleus sp. FACHB-68]|nr:hypothetical protein [Microcoleus sp. FACHB-68]